MHVDDAADRGIADGDIATVSSPYGQIALPVTLTADIVRGHHRDSARLGSQGHRRLADRQPGRRRQRQPVDVERARAMSRRWSGMSWLTGVPVQVERA